MGVTIDSEKRRAAEGKVPRGWITPEADYVRVASGKIVEQDGSVSGVRVARKGKPIPPEQAEALGIGEAPKAKAVKGPPRGKAKSKAKPKAKATRK